MTIPPLSEAKLYDLLLKEEAKLRPRADRMWELVKIEPERWDAPVYGSGSASFWVVGIIGKRVLWYNEFEGEFTMSSFETYGDIADEHLAGSELCVYMEDLIRHVEGEQAYNS